MCEINWNEPHDASGLSISCWTSGRATCTGPRKPFDFNTLVMYIVWLNIMTATVNRLQWSFRFWVGPQPNWDILSAMLTLPSWVHVTRIIIKIILGKAQPVRDSIIKLTVSRWPTPCPYWYLSFSINRGGWVNIFEGPIKIYALFCPPSHEFYCVIINYSTV